MSSKITRLEKSQSSAGDDEIFLELRIIDDLGIYPFATWIHREDVQAIKAEMTEANWNAWTRLSEFNFLNADSAALSVAIDETLIMARLHQEDAIIEKQIDQAKRMREAQGL